MVAEETRPKHDLAWVRSESRPIAVLTAVLGAAGLTVLIVGSAVVALSHGLTKIRHRGRHVFQEQVHEFE